MLTGIALGTGIMLIYLAMFGLAGRRIRSVEAVAEPDRRKIIIQPREEA